MERPRHFCVFAFIVLNFALAGCRDFRPQPPMPEVLATGLNNPTGVAVSGDGRVVVAESGAGRLITPGEDGMVSVFADGFAVGSFLPYDIGPLSLLAGADGSVLVGEGGAMIGEERVSVFSADGTATPERDVLPGRGGNYAGIAIHPTTGALYVASANTNEIMVADVVEGGFGDVRVFLADTTAPPIGFSAPSGLAFEADGSLIVGFSEIGGAGIVRIATEGETAGMLSDVLYETEQLVTSVTVRAADGLIFFAETAFDASGAMGGRIGTIDAEGTVGTFVDELNGPTAVAIGPDGTLYLTELGDVPNGSSGLVSRIETDSQDGTSDDSSPPMPDAGASEPPA